MIARGAAVYTVRCPDMDGLPKSSVLDPVLFILLKPGTKLDCIPIKSADTESRGK